jgi:predicted DCC family thiol-disulfide oxidoreductase YuxK
MEQTWTLFFDGNCAFCSQSVQRIARLDKRGRIYFSSLQGKLAANKGFEKYAAAGDGSMVLLRESDGKFFLRSDSLIELGQALGGAWRITSVTRLIPLFLRDGVYRLIAKNRSKLASSDSCQLATPELLARLKD